jgi:hypothetical protein
MAKHDQDIGVPEYSGQRKINEDGIECCGVANFKEPHRKPYYREMSTAGKKINLPKEWHINIQNRFRDLDRVNFQMETYYHGIDGSTRRADIVYTNPITGETVCIEAQYSHISLEELKNRTKNLLNVYDRVVWLFYHDTMLKSQKVQFRYTWQDKDDDDIKEYFYSGWSHKSWFTRGAQGADKVFHCRASNPPVWSYIRSTPYTEHDYTYSRKMKYYRSVSEFPKERVTVFFHYETLNENDDSPMEIFHEFGKGLTRAEAIARGARGDTFDTFSYVTSHQMVSWKELVYNISDNEITNEDLNYNQMFETIQNNT